MRLVCECRREPHGERRSSGSPDSCSAITDGSAPRSNMRRTRSTIASSARGSPNCTSSINADPIFRRPDRNRARRAADRDRALIPVVFDELHARRGAGGEKTDHLRPVVRRPVGEAEAIALRTIDAFAREPSQLRWRARERAPHLAVESPQAAEARGERDLRDRQRRFVEQLFREVHAPGQRDFDRRRAEMLDEQPPQVPGGHAEAIGKLFHAVAIERAFADQSQRSRHDARCARPGRRARRGFGTAAQARAGTRPPPPPRRSRSSGRSRPSASAPGRSAGNRCACS